MVDSALMTRYEVRDPHEIRVLMHRLINARALLTMQDVNGNVLLLSSVLAIDDTTNTAIFDTSIDDSINQRALAQPMILCIGQVDRIEVRFLLDPLRLAEYHFLPAFIVAMPDQIDYLQRREFYRLQAPATDALSCEIEMPEISSTPARDVLMPVIDISEGGIAVRVPDGVDLSLSAGSIFDKARLRLPNVGVIESRLRIRHIGQYKTPRGKVQHHAGCEWVALPIPMQSISQRYIMRIERERQARDRGLI